MMTYFETRRRELERDKTQALDQIEAMKVAHARAEGAQLVLTELERNLKAADAVAQLCGAYVTG